MSVAAFQERTTPTALLKALHHWQCKGFLVHLPKHHPALSHLKSLSRLRPQRGKGADDARRLARQHGWFVIALNAPVGRHVLTLLLCELAVGISGMHSLGGCCRFWPSTRAFWRWGRSYRQPPPGARCQGNAKVL